MSGPPSTASFITGSALGGPGGGLTLTALERATRKRTGTTPDDQGFLRQRRADLIEAVNTERDLSDAERKGFLDELVPIGNFADANNPATQREGIDASRLDALATKISESIANMKKKREAAEQSQKQQINQPGRKLIAGTSNFLNSSTSQRSGSLIS